MEEILNQEKSVVDITNYEGYWALLSSNDKENSLVALTALENVDFNLSLPYVLLLFKYNEVNSRQDWFDHAPNICAKLKELGIDKTTRLSFNEILKKVKDKCPPEAVQFVIDKFAPILRSYTIEWGFSFMEYLDLELKLKQPDGGTQKV